MEVKDRNKKNKGHEQQLTESNKGPGKHAEERTDELTLANKKLRNEAKGRRTAEKNLLEQMTIFEAFFASTVTPLVFLDKDFNFIRVNAAYAKACQRDIWEFRGRNYF